MSRFGCARWQIVAEGLPIADVSVVVFQSGHVFCDGARIGTYCQSEDHFIADLGPQVTMLVPLDQEGPDRFAGFFRIGERERRPGALVRERWGKREV